MIIIECLNQQVQKCAFIIHHQSESVMYMCSYEMHRIMSVGVWKEEGGGSRRGGGS